MSDVLGNIQLIFVLLLPPVKVLEAGTGRKGKRKCPLGIFHFNVFRKCTLPCIEDAVAGGVVAASRQL